MTVAENVAMGAFGGSFCHKRSNDADEARDEAVRAALRLAGAANLEHSLPAGLGTLLVEDSAAEVHGKASASLSAGEWSAVARARTLAAFNTSRLILMDEPTEGMSDDDEQEFMAKLRYAVDNAPHGPVVVIASQHARLCDAYFADAVTLLGPGGVAIEQTQLAGARDQEF
jgi:ABC-type transport system involved in cytochrome bd biosynthesis fused ATPase/permease subunit